MDSASATVGQAMPAVLVTASGGAGDARYNGFGHEGARKSQRVERDRPARGR